MVGMFNYCAPNAFEKLGVPEESSGKLGQVGGGIMNGYIAFYKGKKIEVYAESSYKAQVKAAEILKARKSYEVTVVLAEKDGQPVVHSTSEIG